MMYPSIKRFVRLILIAIAFPTIIMIIISGRQSQASYLQFSDQSFLPFLSHRLDPTLGTPIFGVQMYGSTSVSSKYHPSLIQSKASWVRVSVHWSNIEPENVDPSSFNWIAADKSLAAASSDAGGLDLMVTFRTNPSWAATYVDGPIDPEDLDEFAEFAEAVVERYDGDGVDDAPGSPVINYWEFYNEPDAGTQGADIRWGNAGDEYAQMLATVYPAVKGANPHAQILLGGIAYDWFEDQGGPFVREFLDDVLLAGGGAYFDIMNFHAYPAFWYNWTSQESPGLLEKAQFIRSKLSEYGIENMPVMVSEAGWHSNDTANAPGTPETQARYVVELFTQSMAADIETMIWFMLYDPGVAYPFRNGLVTNDTPPQPKPAFLSFQTVVTELETAHFDRVLTSDETDSTDMEAYRFIDNVYERTIYVAWLDPIDSMQVQPLRISASLATVRDIYGESHTVTDGEDGQIDGYVTVEISGQPSYIEIAW